MAVKVSVRPGPWASHIEVTKESAGNRESRTGAVLISEIRRERGRKHRPGPEENQVKAGGATESRSMSSPGIAVPAGGFPVSMAVMRSSAAVRPIS